MFSTTLLRIKLYNMVMNGMSLFTLTQRVLPQGVKFPYCGRVRAVQSRSLSGRHVSTSFLDPVLGAMMKQVCWHSRRSKVTEACPRHAWQPQGCCACVGQAVVCRASSLHLSLLRQKVKKCPRRYTSGSQSKSFTWFLCAF